MTAELIDLARRLVACDTTSAKSNLAAIELLAERLDTLGFRTRVQSWQADAVTKANLVATAGPAEQGGLILSGHTDTVPWEGQPGWTRDALALEIGDDRVYGRGSSDMKVFIAHAVVAAGQIERSRLRHPLVLVFTADEEVGCLGAARLAPELTALLDVPLPTLCWIGEPTSWAVFHAHKSFAVFDVLVHGRAGHSGLPDLGLNAIGATAAVLAEIGRYQAELRSDPSPEFREIFPEAPYATVNIGTIAGGAAANMIAEQCVIRLSTRALPDADPLEPYREIERRLSMLDAHDPAAPAGRAQISLGEAMAVPAMLAPRGTELEAALCDRLGSKTVRGALLGADGCRFQSAGIRSLICGPGDFAEAHQPDESISRRAFEEGVDVVRSVVERLCMT
jgi:acetylornithine deacetylase